jgi:hypothetical protein
MKTALLALGFMGLKKFIVVRSIVAQCVKTVIDWKIFRLIS